MKKNNTKQYETFDRQFDLYRKQIDQVLEKHTEGLEYPYRLLDSMRYSLFSGGKRLRPVLYYATLQMLGYENDDKSDLIAASIECIHTYSLIHDDLPCMDDDNERRGMPTNHVVFGQGLALLAGASLLNLAYELCLRTASQKGFGLACQALAAYSGGMGMIGGQVEDIALDERPDESKLLYIYLKKTAALFVASLLCGAYVAQADNGTIKLLAEFGNSFGFAFQIKDDLDDYINGIAQDENKPEKMSWVSVHGIEKATEDLKQHVQKCKQILTNLRLDYDVSFFRAMLDKMFK